MIGCSGHARRRPPARPVSGGGRRAPSGRRRRAAAGAGARRRPATSSAGAEGPGDTGDRDGTDMVDRSADFTVGQSDGAVAVSGDEGFVGPKSGLLNESTVAAEGDQFFSGGGVPYPLAAVMSGADD